VGNSRETGADTPPKFGMDSRGANGTDFGAALRVANPQRWTPRCEGWHDWIDMYQLHRTVRAAHQRRRGPLVIFVRRAEDSSKSVTAT